MNDKATISVPLHKVYSWRIGCSCGGCVDIGSGVIHAVEKAICSKCKTVLPLDDILPVLKSAAQFCLNYNRNCDISLVILLDRCKEIKYEECQANAENGGYRAVVVCHKCFQLLDPDMWIGENCWLSLMPRIPFDQLPEVADNRFEPTSYPDLG
jgi:hypothetical protein